MRKFFDSVLSITGEGVNGVVVTLVNQSNAAVTLYSDNVGTVLPNCTTNANGYFEFYVPNGRYDITFTYQGVVMKQILDVLLVDSYANGWITAGQMLVESTGSNGAPQIASQGDTNTGIRWSTNDTLRFVNAGLESARFDAGGHLLVGHTASIVDGAGNAPLIQVNSSTGDGGLSVTSWSTTAANGANITFGHSKSGTVGTLASNANGDTLSTLFFSGVDSTNAVFNAASIKADVFAGVGVGSIPTQLTFNTSNGSGVFLQNMLLRNGGLQVGQIGTDVFPDISNINDTDTGLRWPSANNLSFVMQGVEVARFGGNTGRNFVSGGTSAQQIGGQVSGVYLSTASTYNSLGGRIDLTAFAPANPANIGLRMARSHGAAGGSYTAVVSGDDLGVLSWHGSDGTTFAAASASIQTLVDSAWSTSPPGAIVFNTAADGGSASEKLRITADGRVYGTTIHAPSGSLTGTTNQYIASHLWTPTLTNVTNLSASTAFQGQFTRVGNVVTASGIANITPTATGAIELGISFPLASSTGSAQRCAGTGSATTVAESYGIVADTTNLRARLLGVATTTSSHQIAFSFTYLIL